MIFISFTQPGFHATWCNCIIQQFLHFERLAWFSYVAERQIARECWYCGLAGLGSPGVKGGRIQKFLWHRETVTCQMPRVFVSQSMSGVRFGSYLLNIPLQWFNNGQPTKLLAQGKFQNQCSEPKIVKQHSKNRRINKLPKWFFLISGSSNCEVYLLFAFCLFSRGGYVSLWKQHSSLSVYF